MRRWTRPGTAECCSTPGAAPPSLTNQRPATERAVCMPETHMQLARITRPSTPITDQAFVYRDRKSTRLNSSHSQISYAVFCLKKKKKTQIEHRDNLERYADCT